jgi:hypothetical protein
MTQRERPGCVPKTVVERWLAAAGLRYIELDLYSKTPQNPNRRLAHFWVELINDASHEQRCFDSAVC